MSEEETQVAATETASEQNGSQAPSQVKPQRTEAETTSYNLKKQAEKAKELGLDPADILGIKVNVNPNLSDDTPLTVGALREFQKQEAHVTAIKMADSIEDEAERTSVRDILEHRIVPSGDPAADFAIARSIVNSTKNSRIAEEMARKGSSTRSAAGGNSPAPVEDAFVPTEQERIFMAPPYNLTKEQIIAKRK